MISSISRTHLGAVAELALRVALVVLRDVGRQEHARQPHLRLRLIGVRLERLRHARYRRLPVVELPGAVAGPERWPRAADVPLLHRRALGGGLPATGSVSAARAGPQGADQATTSDRRRASIASSRRSAPVAHR